MKKIIFIILLLSIYSCENKSKEQKTIQKYIDNKHISGEVVETTFIKNITSMDSVNYYQMEFLKFRSENEGSYNDDVRTLEQSIEFCKMRLELNKEVGFKIGSGNYRSDLIIFELIKEESDKYSEMNNRILGKMYDVIIKLEGEPYPLITIFCLTTDLSKVTNVIK